MSSDSDFPDLETEGQRRSTDHGGFADDFTGLGDDDQGHDGSSDEDGPLGRRGQHATHEDDSDGEEGDDGSRNVRKVPQRQTTREAIERKPLDDGDDSSEEEDGVAKDADQGVAKQPLGSPSSARAGSALSHSHSRSQSQGQAQVDTAEAKKREQDKLLKRWGFDEEDSDEEDEPVSMGSKYLARRRTGSR